MGMGGAAVRERPVRPPRLGRHRSQGEIVLPGHRCFSGHVPPRPQAGSLYWLGHRDATGAYLDGCRTYRLTVPLPVPGKLFWSVTVYDAHTRSEIQTGQAKAVLSSLFDFPDTARDQSVDLFFGPTAPPGHQDQWIQTNPGAGWFVYFRIYGPEQAAFDKTWKPGDFQPQA
jgi:hypothetical protein